MENAEFNEGLAKDPIIPMIISVLDAICRSMPAAQREQIAARLFERAQHLNDAYEGEGAMLQARLLGALGEVARGTPEDGVSALEAAEPYRPKP